MLATKSLQSGFIKMAGVNRCDQGLHRNVVDHIINDYDDGKKCFMA